MVTCRGSTCGMVNKTDGPAWITGNAMVVNTEQYAATINRLFLYYALLIIRFAP